MTMTDTRSGSRAPGQSSPKRLRNRRISLAAQVVGGALLVAGIVLAVLPGSAEAATLTAGPVTLTPGPQYHTGQVIDITVTANATLSSANRASAGFPSGAVAIKVVECADPGGLTANLPKKPDQCDYNTVDSMPGAEVDGSFIMNGYTMYALPDTIVFGEPTDQKPVCGTGNNQCVLGIFTNLNDFTKPHIFSGAFDVVPDPQADNAIVNGQQQSSTASTSPSAGAGTSPTSLAPSTLASTGSNASLPWLIGGGSVLLVAGTFGQRRFSRQRTTGAVRARL